MRERGEALLTVLLSPASLKQKAFFFVDSAIVAPSFSYTKRSLYQQQAPPTMHLYLAKNSCCPFVFSVTSICLSAYLPVYRSGWSLCVRRQRLSYRRLLSFVAVCTSLARPLDKPSVRSIKACVWTREGGKAQEALVQQIPRPERRSRRCRRLHCVRLSLSISVI